MPDPVAVNSMFARIARRYDAANHLLSVGIDRWWRRRLVRIVRQASPAHILDLATGSGDVAFALARAMPASTAITGMDFCLPMLEQAELKKASHPEGTQNVVFRQGDALNLPMPDGSVEAVTISFGLRNLVDRHRALKEMHRVLARGGHVHVLEFSQPHRWFRPLYRFYLRHVMPRVAKAVTGDKAAYDYLCGSVETFPSHIELSTEIKEAGFISVSAVRMTFGIVALHTATK
ncbi:MAG TPA: bifunctional demethylmenaquinone methyltransferase/2-methoxy-6-polyprenyl-1,4-benzoquinol methylase UbiE [Opitutaceae bacterium]|jgi:demethylmenaquinone methyltransferase/2-methoxy-6-polyprenyl-1,4-benzoquinol methylase|nr:bifunctional demethylmenaquinone methyltransferase/2-methoxy-6-polyprenyl-1,4-benzoquinol methylase UbiE [Opitutaceae bacterium]